MRPIILAGSLAALLAGSLVAQAAIANDAALASAEQRLQSEGERNMVLNHMRAGTIAFEANNRNAAELHFDAALNRINGFYADDAQARKARSLWYSEGTKNFLGEPYERAMAFYYRGLLDLQKADYENARASFKSAMIQDSFAEEQQDRADFALMLFLEGWASHLNGDRSLANEAWNELKTMRPDFVAPAANHSALVLAESGKAPRKLADGIGHNLLVYRRGKRFKEQRVKIVSSGTLLYPMEDIYLQASTRGARPIDSVLDGQIRFKKTNAKRGSVLTDVATGAANTFSYITGERASTGVFGAMQLAGTVALAFSSGARAEADTRYWDNLSDAVHITTLPAAEVSDELSLEYLNSKAAALRQPITTKAVVTRDPRGNVLAWARSRPAIEYR